MATIRKSLEIRVGRRKRHLVTQPAGPSHCGPPLTSSGRGRPRLARRRRRVLPAAAWQRNAGVTALPMISDWCRRSGKADGLKSEQKCGTPSSPPKEGCSHADLVASQHMSCKLVAADDRGLFDHAGPTKSMEM